MKSRIFLKLFFAGLLVIAACTLSLAGLVRKAWEDMLRHDIETSLEQKTLMFASLVETSPASSIHDIAAQAARMADARTTVIDSAGKVLADSEAQPEAMENHASRPEFVSALQGQIGSSTRWSHTVGVEFLYVAVPIPGGAVRMAYPLSAIRQVTATLRAIWQELWRSRWAWRFCLHSLPRTPLAAG